MLGKIPRERKYDTTMQWFAVDKAGLAKLLEQRGKSFAVFELLQNAWDEDATEVKVTLEKLPGRPFARLVVEDDDPDGFTDLAHAYTLFAESEKKDDPEKRGRFNLGEKLVLALCREAKIASTKGTVVFMEDGARKAGRHKTERGSVFEATIRMNNEEYEETCEAVATLIPPKGVTTTFNGEELKHRKPVVTFTTTLPTVRADEEGNLTRTTRKCKVEVYDPKRDEEPTIYEMGIPVVENGSRYHINVMQKVPLNMDRDNVTPAYLRKLRVEVLNRVYDRLTKDEAGDNWVTDALGHEDVENEAVETAMDKRFGENRASFDPNDVEAGHRVVASGGVLIHGGTLPGDVWKNVRRAGAIESAGKLMPTPRPYSDDSNATPAEFLNEDEWTEGMNEVAALAEWLAEKLLRVKLYVSICRNAPNFGACYGDSSLDFSLKRLGRRWFDEWRSHRAKVIKLLIHEFAHHGNVGHLDERYHEATTKMAGEVVELALKEPERFENPLAGRPAPRKKKPERRADEMRAKEG